MIRPWLWLPLLTLSTPVLSQDASLEMRVANLHALAGGDWCEPGAVEFDDTARFEKYSFDDHAGTTVTLFRVWCMSGAYNVNHAYYLQTNDNGLTPLAFAVPTFSAVYGEGDDGPLQSLTVTGMGTANFLVNSEFDPETLVIRSTSFWRGAGDASSSGIWAFRDGQFTLVRYEIDASYDGEINPETVIDYPG